MSGKPQLRMHLTRFYNVPDVPPPPGFTVVKGGPADLERWAEVLDATGELGEWSLERAERSVRSGPGRVDPDGIHFVMAGDRPVATACVQLDDTDPDTATLGWVGVVPEFRGKRLGAVVSAAVLRYIERRGFRDCVLRTDDHRIPAIKTYLRLGFEPDLTGDPSYPERWEALWPALGRVPRRPFRLGVVGRRGSSLIAAAHAIPEIEVTALCDIDEATLNAMGDRFGIGRRFTRFEALLESEIDAVVIATPMPLHVPQSLAALRAGKHVLSEVPAAVSFEECWELLEAVRSTGRVYMMAENCCYLRDVVLVGELVRRGLFGELYFGQGEYIHELKELNERTPWRRIWQTGRNGNTYPTHSLGPLMQWMNDRPVYVSCLGSGHHYRDPRGALYENEDTTVTLCKLERGGLVQLRLDMLSERPHNTTYYALQGTKGCYEAERGMGDQPKIWLAGVSGGPNQWQPLSDFEAYLPEMWRNPPEAAVRAGHGGADFWVTRDFAAALCGRKPPAVDVVTALEWTAAGLASQVSIARAGAPVDVPDFRAAWRAGRTLER